MIIICSCSETMALTRYEADQDQALAGYDCPRCGASFYGTHKPGAVDKELLIRKKGVDK